MRSHAINRPEQQAENSVEGEENDKARQDMEEDVYRVASTGAQITLASAKPLLYTFCAKLAYDKYVGRLVLLSLQFSLAAAIPCKHDWNANFHGCNDILSTITLVCLDFLVD